MSESGFPTEPQALGECTKGKDAVPPLTSPAMPPVQVQEKARTVKAVE